MRNIKPSVLIAVATLVWAIAPSAAHAQGTAPTDPQIVQIVQTANQIDIDQAKLALQKSKNQQVRDFANQMISDHTSLEKSVADLGKKLNVAPQDSDTSKQLMQQATDETKKLKSLHGKAFDRATKYVVTHRPDKLDWDPSVQIGGDIVEEIRRLKASDGPDLHIWGSGELLQTLIAADLVDEYRIAVFPVVVGTGKRLFENGVPPRGLALTDTRKSSTGVLVNTYRPAGPLPQG
jgi:predicted outer membrane protein